MKNLRATKPIIDTESMGFRLAKKGEKPDFCVRLLGAARGKLAFFDTPKTTTIDIIAEEGKLEEVRALFESVELTDDDFFYSVSVPYVDKYDFLEKLRGIHAQK